MAVRANITSHLKHFRDEKSILALLRALAMIVAQGRTIEALYGAYCSLAHQPSPLAACGDPELLGFILNHRTGFVRPAKLNRSQMVELYSGDFDVSSLPQDFAWTTHQNIWREGDDLIIGEYGENSRIAYLKRHSCTTNSHYQTVPGVRHIHSILPYGDSGEFLVATGDGRKVLDLWSKGPEELYFEKRLRKYLAGFTAAARVNGEYYFGSDFSSRPNFIESLNGAKYFFPPKAYRMFVIAFFVFADRYLVSVNKRLRIAGGRRTLSIFDTAEKRFVFCDYLDPRIGQRCSCPTGCGENAQRR